MHKLVRVGLLTLALVFAGEAKAQAAWTTLGSGQGGVFLACKTSESGGYGPVWKITLVLATAQGGPQAAARFTVLRPTPYGGPGTVAQVNLAASGGAWDVRTIYASQLGAYIGGRWYPDRYSYAISFYPQTGSTGSGTFPPMANC
jgi:hypothetical protein